MDLKDIQELIKFVAKSGATEVDLEIDNIKISIKSLFTISTFQIFYYNKNGPWPTQILRKYIY